MTFRKGLKKKAEPRRPKKEFSIEHIAPHEKKNVVTAFRMF